MRKTKPVADPSGKKNLKTQKAFTKWNQRQAGYEATVKARQDSGRGFHQPGSLKIKTN